jgi:hypothetical protein
MYITTRINKKRISAPATSSSSSSSSSLKLTLIQAPVLFQILLLLLSTIIIPTQAVDLVNFDNGNGSGILAEKREQLVAFTNTHILEPIQQQYQQLSPKGKFISTAFVGFTTSRATVRTTVQIAKYTGAAFIISEVLNSAGVLNNDSDSNDDNDNVSILAVQTLKHKVTTKVNECRLLVREHMSVQKVKLNFDDCLEKDRVGTLGFTTGIVAALVL